MVEYNEDRELTRLVWDYYQHFMTEFEWRVGRAVTARAKANAAKSQQVAKALIRMWGEASDLEVCAALADGPEVFRTRVRDRVLLENGPAVIVNRCPTCGRVVRTPLARQCFWCGFDWHESID